MRPESVVVLMPQMGESLAEGTLVRWLKQAGDTVRLDEPLFEISTDKVDTEVPSSVEGVLAEILVAEGQTVAVGTVLATIEPSATGAAAITEPGGRAEDDRPRSNPQASDGHFKSDRPPQLIVRRREPPAETSVEAHRAASILTPAVLDAARRGSLPLDSLVSIEGSGRGGRITKRDVERFLAGRPARIDSPGAASSPPAEYLYTPRDEDRVVPMTPVRKKIADHMTWSARISPQATAFVECDMSGAESARAAHRHRLEAEWGAPLTYTVISARAVVTALGAFPALNASVVGDAIVVRPHVNLGIAVALEDTGDLVVPVIRHAGDLAMADLARAIHEAVTRARAGRLTLADVQEGTFTLTNPGIYGGLTGTPILNQPQVGIIGLGAIVKRPVVVDDAIAIRPVMTLALTFDHRAADGMMAFRFLDHVRRGLEARPLG